MAQTVKHLVVLMLENRSFDHMLGFMRSPTYVIDGLTGTEHCPQSATDPTPVSVSADGIDGLPFDAGHSMSDANIQLFFNPSGPPVSPGQRPNSGFVDSYAAQKHVTTDVSRRIMACFKPGDIPALSGLAREFAVCERWFSSVPGPTWPNRLFVHAATSKGTVSNSPSTNFDMPTIFEALSDAGLDWRVYSHDFPLTQMFGRLTLPMFDRNWDSIGGFKRDCRNGALPQYSFIEPKYTKFLGPGNSQHPPESIDAGDQLIDEVYHAVRTSPQWNDAMLLVTYDEHGGTYDHVPPPEDAVAPDHHTKRFSFRRLGVRVPAVVVSPWIPRETIVTLDFDHSSVPATIKKIFGLPAFLTKRDAAAHTFEGMASLAAPRTDAPMRFRANDERHLTQWGDEFTDPDRARLVMATGRVSAAPVSDLQLDLVELARARTAESETPDAVVLDLMRPILTEHDAAVYVREAAQRIRARRTFAANTRAPRSENVPVAADDLERQIPTSVEAIALHVTQDDYSYWSLSVERDDGSLKLLQWQAVTADQLVEDAYQMVIEGRYPRAVVIVDPPRRQGSKLLSAQRTVDASYTKPQPRRAGSK